MNVIYTRFSPRPEHAAERAATLEVQLESCEKYCDNSKLAVDRVIQDPEMSARKTPFFERPHGAELLTLPPNSNVIAMKLDRVFRDTRDGLNTLEHWDKTGTRLHFANEGGCTLNTGSAMGKMLLTFMLGVASWEPDAIGERTSSALKKRIRSNKNHLNPKNIPYGKAMDPAAPKHLRSGVSEGLIDCPEEMRVVQTILNHIQHGNGYRGTARDLNEVGILCRDKDWTGQGIKRVVQRYGRRDDQ